MISNGTLFWNIRRMLTCRINWVILVVQGSTKEKEGFYGFLNSFICGGKEIG